MISSSLLVGMGLGYGAAVPIGPVNVEMARRTLKGGYAQGIWLGCGAVTVDVLYAVLVGIGFRSIPASKNVFTIIGLAGALLLFYLAYGCFRNAMNPRDLHLDDSSSSRRNYLDGLMMTSLNPMTLMFWFVVVPSTVLNKAGAVVGGAKTDVPIACVGVFAAALSWVFFFSGIFAWIQKRHSNAQKLQWIRFCDLAGGCLLLYFASRTIWRVTSLYL